ncbi:MAG: metalloregulator ArsR/SmtB family transcription factor [Pseudomonadales bacterium]|nr:metalloregulator ArsR/SmtB family transcription factor [Pseudomonadales bacterium]
MANYSTQTNLDSVFQALADPTRRAVIQQLASGPASVSSLAEPFSMAMPSFMKHLDVLQAAGLVSSQKQGRVRTCQLNPNAMSDAEDWMGEQKRFWEARLDALAHYVEDH